METSSSSYDLLVVVAVVVAVVVDAVVDAVVGAELSVQRAMCGRYRYGVVVVEMADEDFISSFFL